MHDYTGIGFIVSHDICAIDLDDCVNEAGELNEIAQNVIAYFPNSYIEKSPSGSGLHIYFKAANFDYDTDVYYINNRKLNIGLATLFWTKLLRTRNYFNYSSYPADFRVFNPLYSTGVR